MMHRITSRRRLQPTVSGVLLLFVFTLAAATLTAQPGGRGTASGGGTGRPGGAAPSARNDAEAERRTAAYFDSIRTKPPELRAFLAAMPKGADLHNHLSGAIYAERFIAWAAEDGYCINPATMGLDTCAPGYMTAAQASQKPEVYRALIDAWSMRNWELSGQSGHDHFFDTFGKFGMATYTRTGDMLADVAQLEWASGVRYLELMLTFDNGASSRIGRKAGWTPDFATMRQRLLDAGIRDSLRASLANLDSAERRMRTLLACGKGGRTNGPGGDPCQMTIRYLYQVGRGGAPEAVFAQIMAGFELAELDKRVVGFNLVQPEDYPIPLRDFSLQMQMINYLRPLYKAAHISLHAGELTAGLVPPEQLRFHVRSSVDTAHAERIGHGVAVMYEEKPHELLRMMAERKTLVEICLTSNDVILGVRGKDHPLRTYLKAGVPVALATDDLGVSRSDMTGEFYKAVTEQGVSYRELKQMVRNSVEFSFAEGKSLWSDRYTTFVPECRGNFPGRGGASESCKTFLQSNLKARLSWQLEAAFARFEATH